MTNRRTIASVVEDGLCAQCGWCVVGCPTAAITQRETPAGHLLPGINKEKCILCGTCHRNCSGWHLEEGIIDTRSDLLPGPILASFVGHATDTEIRSKAQSGGIVSAILCHQMESGNIERALVTEMPTDGSLHPYALLAQTREQVLRARGSQYCPVRFDSFLSSTFKGVKNAAIVGTSCQIQTVCNANKHCMNRISLMIGLFCDQILSHCAIDYFLEAAHVRREDVASIRFKDRCHGNFPGDLRIDGCESDPVYLSNDIRLDIKPICTPNRCRLCFDKLNVLADIAVGDTWGIASSREGMSAILVRTQRGLAALHAAVSAGAIVIESVSPQAIIRGQQIEKRGRDWATYTAAWRKMGRTSPELPTNRRYAITSESARQLRKKMRELRHADCLAGQPTRGAAMKEATRQLALQNIQYLLRGNGLRRFIARLLKAN